MFMTYLSYKPPSVSLADTEQWALDSSNVYIYLQLSNPPTHNQEPIHIEISPLGL